MSDNTVETIYTDDKQRRVRIEYDMDGSHCDPREDEGIVEIVTGELRRWNVRTEDAMFQHAFDRFNDMGRAGLFRRWLKIFHDTLAMPVYMMEHSSVALRTSDFGDPWDSGQIGWAYIKPDAEKWEGMDPAEIIKGFVEVLGQWMNGEVYGWIVEHRVTGRKVYDDDTEDEEFAEWTDEDEESCWGYIGLEWAIQAARTEGLGLPEEESSNDA